NWSLKFTFEMKKQTPNFLPMVNYFKRTNLAIKAGRRVLPNCSTYDRESLWSLKPMMNCLMRCNPDLNIINTRILKTMTNRNCKLFFLSLALGISIHGCQSKETAEPDKTPNILFAIS